MNAPLSCPVIAGPDDNVVRPLLVDAELYAKFGETGAFAELSKLELRSGVVVRMNTQAVPHMRAKLRLARLLENEIARLALSLEIGVEGSVRLSDFEVPEPDICLWDGSASDGFIPGSTVQMVVEVADATLAGDLTRKATLYASHGIAEYWVADIKGRVVHRMTGPADEGYAERAVFRCGERIDSVTIPGLAIDLPEF